MELDCNSWVCEAPTLACLCEMDASSDKHRGGKCFAPSQCPADRNWPTHVTTERHPEAPRATTPGHGTPSDGLGVVCSRHAATICM